MVFKKSLQWLNPGKKTTKSITRRLEASSENYSGTNRIVCRSRMTFGFAWSSRTSDSNLGCRATSSDAIIDNALTTKIQSIEEILKLEKKNSFKEPAIFASLQRATTTSGQEEKENFNKQRTTSENNRKEKKRAGRRKEEGREREREIYFFWETRLVSLHEACRTLMRSNKLITCTVTENKYKCEFLPHFFNVMWINTFCRYTVSVLWCIYNMFS